MSDSAVRTTPRGSKSPPRPRSRALLLALIVIGVLAAGYYAFGALGLLGGSRTAATPGERRALGPADARVQIVVYFDFQCPHCDSLHSGAEAQIVETYVKTNKARLEVRPLAFMGPDSVRAAEAALCAADQGHFWDYRDELFSSFRQNSRTAYSQDGLLRVASRVGLDTNAFGTCLSQHQRRAEVDELLRQGQADGVQVVPTVLVDGQKLEGALPFGSFAAIIERSLAR